MPRTVEELLFDPDLGCGFDPFQAVRVLELLANDPPGPTWRDADAAVRFRSNVTMAFPPSLLAQVIPPAAAAPDPAGMSTSAARIRNRYARGKLPVAVLNFFGLFGPEGALPLTYTRTLCELDLDRAYRKGGTHASTRTALRDWLDLFNDRMAALLYRAWGKYRLPVGFLKSAWKGRLYAPAEHRRSDKMTEALFAAVGLGVPGLRDRMRVETPAGEPLIRVEDLAMLHYAGAFARRRPGAYELEAILADYFAVRVRVQSLTGQWLALPPESQTKMGREDHECSRLGVNAVAGEQIWDVNSKFRVRLGPLRYAEFIDYLPDPTPVPERKGAFLLSQVTRLYVGPEFDYEVQLVLFREEVPDCVLADVDEGDLGVRLGWNTWLTGEGMPAEVDDVMFDAPTAVTLPRA